MTAALIEQAAGDGVRLALTRAGTIKASGDAEAVARWREQIRDHKTSIVDTLSAAPGRHWLLHFVDREPLEVIFTDDLTHGEVLTLYPGAVAAEPLPYQ